MKVLLTVVIGFISERGSVRSRAITDEFEVSLETPLANQVADKIEQLRKSWPSDAPGLQNVLSASHCVLP